MKKFFGFMMCASLAVLLSPAMVCADFTAHLQESGVGQFDFMAVVWVSDAQLAPPVFRNDSDGQAFPGWTQQGNATVAYASFPSTDLTDFDLAFVGSANTDVTTFNFFAFNGDQLVDSAVGTRNGTGPYNDNFSFSSYTGSAPARDELVASTPEPATMALLGLGGSLLLRRRKK